ncbi:AMP-binding protein [Paenarthrobacter sp. Z7-10]|uniref:class I adenylate-forming enzyme family protein n=1 Tax=Paenarthrobacter sp. Z7-10 TaxID=2787635 RepID=UPI0022A94ED3|nr:AMP-binding protein [Paenarthrobacter sp. Z7-10]MCZ2402653.1 AMP-binding protein [Paenarthrobacter sp. Z7-10]
MPFLDRLQRWAREHPDRLAVGVGGSRLSYAELVALATGMLPGTDCVTALCQLNSVELVAGFTAAVAGKRRCAVLNPQWPAAQRVAVQQRLAAADWSAEEPAIGGPDLGFLEDGPAASTFLVGLTSGTSAVPKGFSRSRGSWQVSFDRSIDYFGLAQDDVTLAPGPLSASLNLYALAECLYAGAPFVTLPAFDLAEVFRCISGYGVTRLVVAPAMLRMIAERGNLANTPHTAAPSAAAPQGAGIRSIISAGARLDAHTLAAARRWAPNATIFEYYGASELGFLAAARLDPGAPDQRTGTAVGPAFPGVQLSIRGSDGAELACSEPGTIHARSDLVSGGYLWGDDGLAFSREGDWCTVGDQGFLAPDGVLHMLGRRSDMMVTAGHNVYPHEVELALLDVPGVAAAVVAGLPDGARGHKIAAAVLPATAAGFGPTATTLRAEARVALPDYKRPGAYFALSELPLTPGGKVSRSLLADWISQKDPRVRRLS